MTATAIRRDAPLTPPAAPPGMTQSERFAWALRAREWVRARTARAMSLPKRIWRKMVEVFHLDPVINAVKAGWSWLKDKATWAGEILGTGGLVGLGLLSLTTDSGRSVWSYALKPVGWLGRGISWLNDKMKAGLHRLGRPGIWVADKIEDTENWFIKKGTETAKWWDKRVAKHVKTDSATMRTARLGGVLLVTRSLLMAALPLPVKYLLGAAVAVWSVYDGADIAMKVGEDRGWLKVSEDKTTGAKTATAKVEAKASTPGGTAKAAAPSSGNRKH